MTQLGCRYCGYPRAAGRAVCSECGTDFSRTNHLLRRWPELVGDAWWIENRLILRWICIAESMFLALVGMLMFGFAVFSIAGSTVHRVADVVVGIAVLVPPGFWTVVLCWYWWRRWRGQSGASNAPDVMQPLILATLWAGSLPWFLGPLMVFTGDDRDVATAGAVIAVLLNGSVAICLWKQLRYTEIFSGRRTSRAKKVRAKLGLLSLIFVATGAGTLRSADEPKMFTIIAPIMVPTMLRQLLPLVPTRRGRTEAGGARERG